MFSLMSLRSKPSTSSRVAGYDNVAVRLARPEDEPAIRRIASLDSKPVPVGHLLVAEADSEVIAALPVTGGTAIADPFRWTSDLIALLEMRARQLSAADLEPLPATGGA